MSRPAPDLTLPNDGTCSFCGKSRQEVRTFVGSSMTDTRICDGCVGLCCSVLAEAAKLLDRAPTEFQSAMTDVEHGELPELSAAGFPDELLLEINAVLARQGPPATETPIQEFRCSFCDVRREEVPKLVTGPRVFICNDCVGHAVAAIKAQPT